MRRTKIMKASLFILVLSFGSYSGFAQEPDDRPAAYRIPGNPTLYTNRVPHAHKPAVDLVPIAGIGNEIKPDPVSYFHLEFVVKTIDSGKVIGTRTYTMDANTYPGYHAQYRSDTFDAPHTRNRMDIDCGDVRLAGSDSVSLNVSAMLSTELNPAPSSETTSATYNGSFYTLAVFGKPTVVFSADAQAPNRKIQMEVTVTPIRLNSGAKP